MQTCNCGWHHFAELHTDKIKRTSACKHSVIMHSVGITSLYNRHYNLTADGSFIETELVWHQTQKSSHSWFRCLFVCSCLCVDTCVPGVSIFWQSLWNKLLANIWNSLFASSFPFIIIVLCLPPPCCLTARNLRMTSAIWSLILSSSPRLAVPLQLHPADLGARPDRSPRKEAFQLRATKHSPSSAYKSFPLRIVFGGKQVFVEHCTTFPVFCWLNIRPSSRNSKPSDHNG